MDLLNKIWRKWDLISINWERRIDFRVPSKWLLVYYFFLLVSLDLNINRLKPRQRGQGWGRGETGSLQKKPDSSDSRGENPKFKKLLLSPFFSLQVCGNVIRSCSRSLQHNSEGWELNCPIDKSYCFPPPFLWLCTIWSQSWYSIRSVWLSRMLKALALWWEEWECPLWLESGNYECSKNEWKSLDRR